jgi:phage terminase large subunit
VPTVDTGYRPRAQFIKFHMRRQRWSCIVSHPRAGKTVSAINDLVDAALRCTLPQPRFAYVAPYYSQAKDIAWGYLKHFTSAIPGAAANESELRVDIGDRRVRLYGADNYDRLRGIYLDGVVLDEYGDMDPRAWPEVIRPRLADRLGWAAFLGTAHGYNHFAEMAERAAGDEAWYYACLRASETGILPKAELDDARQAMSEDQYLAEFECSFQAAIIGSIWGRELAEAEAEGRICAVPHDRGVGVHTWWDLGVRNATSIWFTQDAGREVNIIDHVSIIGGGLPEAAQELQKRPYRYIGHHGPHDSKVQEWGTGKTRIETARALGIEFTLVPDIGLEDGIQAARLFFPRCRFDREKTAQGRDALASYHRSYDARRKIYSAQPVHDWSSDDADAFRYLAVGHKFAVPRRERIERPRFMEPGQSSASWLGA